MFGKYIVALRARLHGLFSPEQIVALSDTLCNATQELDHRGPVSVSTYTQQPAFTLNNGFADQHALQVQSGHSTFGPDSPEGTANPNQVVFNNATTFQNYAVHNYPVLHNDDVRFSGDLMPKFCVDGLGMGIARIQLLASISPGQIVPAQLIDGNGNPVGSNASGMAGSGKIMVRLSSCLFPNGGSGGSAGSAGSAGCNTYSSGTCGYASYFADNAIGGAVADCASRVNIAPFWEIISLFFNPNSQQGQIEAVTKICCGTVNGSPVLVVCTTTYSVCANVVAGSQDCGGGSCS